MIQVYASTVIDAPPARVWSVIRDFNALPQWHPMIAESRIEGNAAPDKVGCIRSFRTKDGGAIREQLLSLSDYDFECAYSILDSPLGVENYVARLKLTPVTDGDRTFAEWSAEFDCAPERERELAELVGNRVFQGGLTALKAQVRAVIRVTRSCVVDAPIGGVWAVLRDFNSHLDWHPIIERSVIERGESADQVGCVRNFTLKDGNHIREQLLTLSDRDHVSTYCILEATVPLQRYLATLHLKPVTDGDRTFWHWQSTFDTPRGRERELGEMVGRSVYEAGMKALAEYLAQPAARRATRSTVAAASSSTTLSTPAIVMRAHGGPEVLVADIWPVPPPGPGEVRMAQRAIGVNFIDVYTRRGIYPLVSPPGVPGVEAAGAVESVGEGVHELLPGDRVAYAALPAGAYAAMRSIAAASVVRLPDDVGDEEAAALMLKGMTAEYLLHRTHRVMPGETLLVHAAAGATGLFLCQWARALGARVLGTVSSEGKARIARDNGCEVPIVTADYRFADAVLDATAGRGADVVYDGLGAGAATDNLRALAVRGHWVSYGQASGSIESMPLATLSSKSITLSRPAIMHFVQDRSTLLDMAARVFDAKRRGILRIPATNRFALAAAAEAHRALESRATTGPLVLLP